MRLSYRIVARMQPLLSDLTKILVD